MPTLHASQTLAKAPQHRTAAPAKARHGAEAAPAAEEMLREMAFIYHLTRSVRQAMTQPTAPAEKAPA